MKTKHTVAEISKFLSLTLLVSVASASAFAEGTIVEVGGINELKKHAVESDGTLTFSSDTPKTIRQKTYGWVFEGEYERDADEPSPITVTVGKNVDLQLTNSSGLKVWDGANLVVEGKISYDGMGTITLVDGEHTVSSTGTIVTEAMTLFSGAKLTVNGVVNLSQELAIGEYFDDGACFIAENAKIDIGFAGIVNYATMQITGTTLATGNIYNAGTINISGDSTLNVSSINGEGKIIVDNGARLTISSNALLKHLTVEEGATVNFGRVVEGSSVALESNKEQTVIVAETGTVELSTSASGVVINKAEALNVADVAGISENLVAAWDFEITNDNSEEITVSATIEAGLDVNTIKIWHGLEGGSWELLNENEGFEFDYNAESGKLTFSTNTFSPIVVSGSAAAPEPSAFGLLAGLGALALVASRRRRK